MAPKKKDEVPQGTPVPELEPEVELPEDVGEVADPPFNLVLGSLAGHSFLVQDPPAGGDEAGAADAPLPAPREFDPCALAAALAKEPGDLLAKRMVVLEREELQAKLTADDTTLAAVVKSRVQLERAARSRAKTNAARRRAIEAAKRAAEAADAAEEGEADPDAAEAAPPSEEAVRADFALILKDYPSSPEEFRELSDLGLAAEGLIDLWAAVYLAGQTLVEAAPAPPTADGVQQAEGVVPAEGEPQAQLPPLELVPCEAPEPVRLLHGEIGGAAAGSDLADSTVCTIRESQVLSLVPEGVAPGEHVQQAILSRLDSEVAAKRKFSDWLRGTQRVVVPSAPADKDGSERRVYERLMGSVDPSQHTVPLVLHCLAEQVASSLEGDSKGKEDEVVLSGIKDYLCSAFDDVLTEGATPAPRHRSPLGEPATQPCTDPWPEQGKPAIVIGNVDGGEASDIDHGGERPRRGSLNVTMAAGTAETVTLHRLDFEACGHSLAGSGGGLSRLWSGDRVVEATRAVLSHASVPGTRRSGLPASAVYSAAQQTGLQSRIYPFAPSVATEEFEQMWLLHAFEGLLSKAYPEKKWCLADRSYRECIPREFLAQTLQAALASEPLVDTAYLPRHDCLIIALHHRSLPSGPLWHSWKCDLASEHGSDRWADGLFTVPTYNDWLQLFGGGAEGAPTPRLLLDGFDARQAGYGEVVEKLATPADGSVILVSKIGYGKTTTLPRPSNDAGGAGALGQLVEPPPRVPVDGEDVAPAVAASAAAPPPPDQCATGAPPTFDAPVRYESRLVRVAKDGLTFGFVPDLEWAARLRSEQLRREEAKATALEEEAAAAAARAEEAGEQGDAAAPATGGAEDLPTGMPFEGSQLGTFWMAMPGGARCTARAHHEALPQADLSAAPAEALPPPMGVVLAYTLANGQVVQVFGDASVQLRWPLASLSGTDGVRAAEEAAASGARVMAEELGMPPPPAPPPPVPLAGGARVVPGCPQDVEVSRTITPLGTLTRRLLSGRLEVYYTDGTSAVRNPTGAELDVLVAALRSEPGGGGSRLDFLERLSQAYGERHQEPLTAPPEAKAVRDGLPGHWVVVRPDGSIFGRVPRPPPPPPEPPPPTPPKPPTPEVEDKKAAPKKGGKAAAKEELPPEPEPAPPPPPPPPPPLLHELVGGYFVDDGDIIEYVIDPVAVARQLDIMTQHKTMTNSKGLTMYEDPEDTQKIIVHADGTQVIKTLVEDGTIIEVSKSPMAHVRCELRESREIRVVVTTSDGTYLIVVPQLLQGKGELVPVVAGRGPQPWQANHASVLLTNWEGASVLSTGAGEVKVYTKPQGSETDLIEQTYTAHCTEGLLSLVDKRGVAFEVYGDQTVRVSQEMGQAVSSPRCAVQRKAYELPPGDAGSQPPPEATEGPPPRTFVVHGNGDAEELLRRSEVEELIAAARADPSASVVEEPPEHAGSLLHRVTVYRSRVPDAPVFSSADLVALPDTLQGNSAEMLGTATDGFKIPALQPPGITEYSKFVAYPPLSEEDRIKFQGTLAQYRQWEAEQLAKSRAVMKPPEKPKKQKEKAEVKKKKKKGEPPTPPPEPVVVEPDPAFIQDFTIDAFDHHLKVLRRRADDRARFAAAPPPAAAPADVEEGRGPEEDTDVAAAATDGADAVEAGDPGTGQEQAAASEPLDEQQLEDDEESEKMTETDSSFQRRYFTRKEMDIKLRSMSYWDSEPGMQFLRDSAPTPQSPYKPECARLRHSKAPLPKRSPWNPRLVGEPEPEDQPKTEMEAPEILGMATAPQMFSSAPPPVAGSTMPGGALGASFAPASRAPAPILPERDLQHEGAHPDKKGVEWDVYGEPRPQRPPVSQAHITINSDYVAIEGETDRRVRTCSVAHKKNATKAPSVSTVRKSGAHTLGLGSQVGPREILGDPREILGYNPAANAEEHWKLTSTMQGLGDSTKLVEVTPGSLRFGPLRLGSLYRMSFFLRNLDVDVTRFHVRKVESDLVLREHQSGHLAPGLAERVVVDVAAKVPCSKVEQMIEIKVKAHVIKVLVTARIFDAEEYDRLDAESLALHGRRIGRHREVGDDVNKKSPVQLVDDEKECRAKLGDAYLPPPLDFGEDPATTSPTFGNASA